MRVMNGDSLSTCHILNAFRQLRLRCSKYLGLHLLGVETCVGRTPMPTIQSLIFGMMLYSMPSVFLMALLVCRQGFDPDPKVVGRGFF
jgi:hypothetical protein